MSEIELKLLLEAEQAPLLRQRIAGLGIADGTESRKTLRSIYHDTETGALRAAGITLRLRHDGKQWLQTVKRRGRIAGGLSRAEEVESAVPDGRLSLAAIGDKPLRRKVRTLIGAAALRPVLETIIDRASLDVALDDGTRANVAVDTGEIAAAELRRPIAELEIELLRGDPKGLYAVARAILPEGGLRFSRLSKAARGFLLAEKGYIEPPAVPRKARPVPIGRKDRLEGAVRGILRECLDQITGNVDAVRRLDAPEGPHQLRIGLRRMRTALTVFKPVLGGAERARSLEDCRWLAHRVGRLRDLDVVRETIVAPLAAARPDDAGLRMVIGALEAQSRRVREELRTLLVERRVQALLIGLSEFIETGGIAGAKVRAAAFARQALHRRWKDTTRHAKGIADFDLQRRHALRKRLKQMRYTLEFFGPLMPPGREKAFSARLRTLQIVFGDLNDAAMAEAVLTAPPLGTLADPAAQRAIGHIVGLQQAKAEQSWSNARALWKDLAACDPPWNGS